MLLWLWHRLGAVAPIQPFVWEPPYAMGVALRGGGGGVHLGEVGFFPVPLCTPFSLSKTTASSRQMAGRGIRSL